MTHPIEILITKNSEEIKKVWEEINQFEPLSEALKRVITILQLTAENSEDLIESFEKISKKYKKNGSFKEFCNILTGWVVYNKLQHKPDSLKQTEYLLYLKTLGAHYETIQKYAKNADLVLINNTLNNIKNSYKSFSRRYFLGEPKLDYRSEVLSLEEKSLKKIFKFYSSHHLFLGQNPSFYQINQQKNVWDCGTFLTFCKHFCIFYNNKESKFYNRPLLQSIFLRNSVSNISMNLSLFVKSIDFIAESSYTASSDQLTTLKKSNLTLQAKRIILYESLKLADLGYIKSKLQGLKVFFVSNKTEPRISLNDPSLKYKFSISPEKRTQLKAFIEEKNKEKSFYRHSSLSKIESRIGSRQASAKTIRRKGSDLSSITLRPTIIITKAR
ncbi:hypothetical protein SteCoe_1674 [Stentor coeruleus]|uniref:Uncharacterized protein n=1 Tax=Stentor coeruleus TaxID=5963 RepID=A0A1R2D167_9CILI|nr:hypothetical protein SteCoe_1674 [Stentor coeruleus]